MTEKKIVEEKRNSFLKLEIYGILILCFSILLFLSLVSYSPLDTSVPFNERNFEVHNLIGPVGARLSDIFLGLFGIGAFFINGLFFLGGFLFLLKNNIKFGISEMCAVFLFILSQGIIFHTFFNGISFFSYPAGGIIGTYSAESLKALFKETGTLLIAFCAFIVSILFLMKVSFVENIFKPPLRLFKNSFNAVLEKIKNNKKSKRDIVIQRNDAQWINNPEINETLSEDDEKTLPALFITKDKDEGSKTIINPDEHSGKKLKTTQSKKAFILPSLSLLDYIPPKDSVINRDELHSNADKLSSKLRDYNIEGSVVEIHPGPVVTMYEFQPASGVKIRDIINRAEDLAMALKAISIRIVAPIPGKDVVGIELPNNVREMVYLKEILASDGFRKNRSKLTIALGKDIFGNPVSADLCSMPHLLLAGTTGSGKSVAIHSIILSLLFNVTPSDVRIILVDPKVVELQEYEGIPHLLLPVVYDPKHATLALRWAVQEMERRYELLGNLGVRNIFSYNQKIEKINGGNGNNLIHDTVVTQEPSLLKKEIDDNEPLEKLPYIVVIIDEFADLMMIAGKDVETAVARLSQKARAAGIHLVMATQRPSKEVITGLIKANFSSRLSFQVTSKVDSRIILDTNGAEALLGKGDMLFLKHGLSTLQRVHGCYVSDEEIKRVVNFIKGQGKTEYKMDILSSTKEEIDDKNVERDEVYKDAVRIFVETRRASVSYLQRRLRIGYNRAARIVEQMEREGIVGPPDHKGEREVLVSQIPL